MPASHESAEASLLPPAEGPRGTSLQGEQRICTQAPRQRPICVDLDGTLLKTDSLIEGGLAIIAQRGGITRLPGLLAWKRAVIKRRVAALANLPPQLLPYNTELIDFLLEKKRQGHPIILATAADRSIAVSIAEHLGFFDEVIASDGCRNLKGKAKSQELVRRFGEKGFDYAGNDANDLPVWRKAHGIIIVNASSAVARKARSRGTPVGDFQERTPRLLTAFRAMRPHQWVKNLLIFVPLLTSQAFTDWPGLFGSLLMFASFCATASGIYLVNDLLDLEADRRHPRKRQRPFASGALPLGFGIGQAALLLAIGLVLAVMAGAPALLLAYAATALAYSMALKRYPLADVFALAALYTLRILAGAAASHHPATLWLLTFSSFIFLSLALVKRCAELPKAVSQSSHAAGVGRGYSAEDRFLLVAFGVASAFASSIVLCLFVGAVAQTHRYRSPEVLWILVPLILFWQCRLWLATERGHMHDDPIIYASRDWVSRIVALVAVSTVLVASLFAVPPSLLPSSF